MEEQVSRVTIDHVVASTVRALDTGSQRQYNHPMNDPIQYLCTIGDAEKLKKEAVAYRVKVLSERQVNFIDGSSRPQFTVELDGVRGFLVPASEAARERQKLHGRWLKPYNFVVA